MKRDEDSTSGEAYAIVQMRQRIAEAGVYIASHPNYFLPSDEEFIENDSVVISIEVCPEVARIKPERTILSFPPEKRTLQFVEN